MTIKESIESDLKIALLAGEKDKITTLRGLKSVILYAEIANNVRDKGLDDEQVMQLLNKEVKKRLESAEMYIQGGSKERADKELAEKLIITNYLPAQMSDDELSVLVDQALIDTKATGMQDMGKVIALVKERSGGQADGGRIASVVKAHLKEIHEPTSI